MPRADAYELRTHAGSDVSVDIAVVVTGDIEGYVLVVSLVYGVREIRQYDQPEEPASVARGVIEVAGDRTNGTTRAIDLVHGLRRGHE